VMVTEETLIYAVTSNDAKTYCYHIAFENGFYLPPSTEQLDYNPLEEW